jgi:pimeloyl-ACP methyl ester carboxylesterase
MENKTGSQNPVRIFLHGLESSNRGVKAVFFRENFPHMIVPTFTGDLVIRMEKLREILRGKSEITMVGSSFGGLMATIFAMEHPSLVRKLILLAPAIHIIKDAPTKIRAISTPVQIYHGNRDEVIPLADVQRLSEELFQNLQFNIVPDDHSLHDTFKTMDWKGLL